MTQSGKLISVAVVLSLLAILSGLLFGQEKIPQMGEWMDVWVSRADRSLLHCLTETEKSLFMDILAKQKKREDTGQYEDLVLCFEVMFNGREIMRPALYRLSDGTNDFVLKYPDGRCYGLGTREVLQFLTSDLMDELFEYIESAPTMTVTESGQSLTLHCVENGWYYQKIDNSFFMDGVLVKDELTELTPQNYRRMDISFSTIPQSVQVKITLAGASEPIFEGRAGQLYRFNPPVSGLYKMQVTAYWTDTDQHQYGGYCVYELDLQIKKAPRIRLSAWQVFQGNLLEVTVMGPQEPDKLSARFDGGRAGPFIRRDEGIYSCLLAAQHPGIYSVSVSGAGAEAEQPIRVVAAPIQTVEDPFPLQTEETAPQLSLEGVRDQLVTGSAGKYWSGTFRYPVQRDPDMGSRQRFEGQPERMDRTVWWMAEHQETIFAANSGQVFFVGQLDQGGLTVAVYHGMGLYTWYYGLSEALVDEGEIVYAETPLGLVLVREQEPAWFGVQAVFRGVPLELSYLCDKALLEG